MTNIRVCIKKLDKNYHIFLVDMDVVLRRRKKKTTVKQKQLQQMKQTKTKKENHILSTGNFYFSFYLPVGNQNTCHFQG